MNDSFLETLFPPRSELAKFKFPPARFPLREYMSVSFSGGKTSAYMLAMILDAKRAGIITQPIIVTFCNTGLEHEETLKFVQRCDEHFQAGVVWLEAVINPELGEGTGHKIVNFDTASRDGEPFEKMIEKYGIPNAAYSHCNRELKLQAMKSYHKALGLAGRYSSAVGIRADEIRRVSWDSMENLGVFYPCIDAGVFKQDVGAFWQTMPFKLNIPEEEGNCVTCWKKSDRKLFTIGARDPQRFNFFKRMEAEHGLTGSFDDRTNQKARVFFRGNRSTADILEACKRPFEPFVDGKFIPFDDELDVGGACSESCEIHADED